MPMSAFAKRTSRTYAMPERSDRLDFYIRDQTLRSAITEPHKHDYFQIQINLGGDTKQQIDDVTRPFPTGSVAFIAPHWLHMIPHPEHSRFIVINFALDFLGLDVDAVDGRIDLGSIPVIRFPELAPFRFQDEMDFRLTGSDLVEVERIVHLMMEIDSARGFGATSRLRGYLLQLIGLVCARYADPLLRLAALSERAVSRKQSRGYDEKNTRNTLVLVNNGSKRKFVEDSCRREECRRTRKENGEIHAPRGSEYLLQCCDNIKRHSAFFCSGLRAKGERRYLH